VDLGDLTMISSLELPEVYGLIGTFLFVFLSLYTAIFDRYHHKGFPYLYQAAAVAGFGQLIYSSICGQIHVRLLSNLFYVVFSLTNVIGLFVRMLYRRPELSNVLKCAYLFLIVLPSNLTVASLYFGYLQPGPLPLSLFPLEASPLLLVVSAIGVLAGVLATNKPEPLRAVANVTSVKIKLDNKTGKR